LPTSVLVLGVALTLNATPTPTPTPKPSFFSLPTARVNPSATPPRTGAATGRGMRLGVDRGAQTPAPRPTPTATAKKKASPSGARKSPTVTPTPEKAAKLPTPSPTPSPQKETSPAAESSPTTTPAPSETVTPPPTPSQTATAAPTSTPTATPRSTATPTSTSTATPKSKATPTPRASASPTATPVSPPTKTELTLTKFEPPQGSRSAQLSFRISVPKRMEYPVINFTVETSSGKIFERVYRLPGGSAFVEPGDTTEHTVALDPVPRDDWADAYAKTDRAKFNWSIEGESSGGIEKPVKEPWP
jgi:hypothetical protein